MKLRRSEGSAFASLGERIGGWTGGATGARLTATAREDSTAMQYSRHWDEFSAWCAENGLNPLPATTDMVVSYIGSLAERGTIAADSLQPYLSAINSMHADFFGPDARPAVGHLVQLARGGMRRGQALMETRDTRVPLPADAALRVLSTALSALPTLARTHTHRAAAEYLRRSYSLVLSFVFMGRQDTSTFLASDDHGIDDDFIWLRLTEKMKRGQALRRIVRLPLAALVVREHASALPDLARLGRAYIAARDALGPPAARFFQLPGERTPTTRDMSSWVATALAECDIAAPPGFAYLGHSLRSGGSSAAEAIGVPRVRGNWIGGWSLASDTREKHYIDPSILPTPEAFALFGWLLVGSYHADHAVWTRMRGAAADDSPGERGSSAPPTDAGGAA